MFRRKPRPIPKPQPAPESQPTPGTVHYQRVASFGEAERMAGAGYLNEAVLADLQSSWFFVGEPRLIDLPDFFAPFFATLGLVSAIKPGQVIRVLDFGGAIGRYGVYADAYFSGRVRFEWAVVETAMYCVKGREMNVPATFYTSLDDIPGDLDVVMFSGVLQYIDDWESVLRHPKVTATPLVFITRTPIGEETAFLQTAHYVSGPMSYPGRVLPKDRIGDLLGQSHKLFSSWNLEHHYGEMGAVAAPSQIWMARGAQ